jgi:hypothetical protein
MAAESMSDSPVGKQRSTQQVLEQASHGVQVLLK